MLFGFVEICVQYATGARAYNNEEWKTMVDFFQVLSVATVWDAEEDASRKGTDGEYAINSLILITVANEKTRRNVSRGQHSPKLHGREHQIKFSRLLVNL